MKREGIWEAADHVHRCSASDAAVEWFTRVYVVGAWGQGAGERGMCGVPTVGGQVLELNTGVQSQPAEAAVMQCPPHLPVTVAVHACYTSIWHCFGGRRLLRCGCLWTLALTHQVQLPQLHSGCASVALC